MRKNSRTRKISALTKIQILKHVDRIYNFTIQNILETPPRHTSSIAQQPEPNEFADMFEELFVGDPAGDLLPTQFTKKMRGTKVRCTKQSSG